MNRIQHAASAASTTAEIASAPRSRRGSHSQVIIPTVPEPVTAIDPGASGHRERFAPGMVRYVKLGENGKWANDALEKGIIPFGYSRIDHQTCFDGNWPGVRRQLVGMGRTAGGVGQGLRELKEFYTLPDDTLWVTMADGHFWWAFAKGPVLAYEQGDGEGPSRYRQTATGWSKVSLTGAPLTVRSLGSALTLTADYRMTICAVKPCPDEWLKIWPVDKKVGNVRNKGAELVLPL